MRVNNCSSLYFSEQPMKNFELCRKYLFLQDIENSLNFTVKITKIKISMNLKIRTSILLFVGCLIASSCGGGMKTVKNEFLGEIPSIEKHYAEKVAKKEKDLKECKDMQKAFKLSKEVDLLKDEWKLKIEESFKAGLPAKSLPFESMGNKAYSVDMVTVSSATKGNLSLKFAVTIKEDLKNEWDITVKDLFIYFKAVDKAGNDIEGSKTVAVNMGRTEMKAGATAELSGVWQSKAIINMEQFAAVKEITKEEYEKQ